MAGLHTNFNTCGNCCIVLIGGVIGAQIRRCQIAATTTASCYAQLGLQIAQAGCTRSNHFLNLAVGNRITDTNKHGDSPDNGECVALFQMIFSCICKYKCKPFLLQALVL